MKKVTQSIVVILIAVITVTIFNACKKESKEDVLIPRDEKKDDLQSSSSNEINFEDLTPFLNGDTVDNTLITQMIDSDLIPYGYFNPDFDINNIYYFSEESLFLSFIQNKPEENEILERIHLADSLYHVIDENDTSELDLGNNLFFKTRETNADRRLVLFGKDVFKGTNYTGQSRYFYGPRANLGSNWNNQISSIKHYGTGVAMWCHLRGWRGTRMFVVVVFTHFDIPDLGPRHNNKFVSYF